jgi:tRNA(Ile)-lysidine synthase
MKKTIYYPRPGEVGGRLIRKVIAFLRERSIQLPISSHILIAVSGGADSLALAYLLVKYGRRIGVAKNISLVHVNHGWRGKESNGDELFVKRAARKWGVKCIVRRLNPRAIPKGESWENAARVARYEIFQKLADQYNGDVVILTAHTADDLAETVLWRLFTGSAATHGGGIAVRHGVFLRPLLQVRKEELKSFLKEEEQEWREDRTNRDPRFLRVQVRQEMLPIIERVFPRAVEHLVSMALNAQRILSDQTARADEKTSNAPLDALLSVVGIKFRRANWDALHRCVEDKKWTGELHLPERWRLVRSRNKVTERWVLERPLERRK